ncbi:hypothetical protein [Helicobacter sp. T3_23-1056]
MQGLNGLKRLLQSSLVVLCVLGFYGCDNVENVGKSPIEVRIEGKSIWGHEITAVHIISLVDSITIKDMFANRGNCMLIETAPHNNKEREQEIKKEYFPFPLRFGDSGERWFGCEAHTFKEIKIVTDKGTYDFSL